MLQKSCTVHNLPLHDLKTGDMYVISANKITVPVFFKYTINSITLNLL